jgi:LacI family transcriptional regulator
MAGAAVRTRGETQVKKPTMADIASLAGVSVTTVSHVLNETRPVADAPRDRVLQAVEQTGYVRNQVTRSPASARTGTIGLAMSALSNAAFASLLAPIEAESRSRSYSLFLSDTADREDQELEVVKMLHSRGVDGVIIAPAQSDSAGLRFLAEHGTPTVVIDRFTTHDFDQVGTENIKATALLSEHLARNGHERIAMLTGLPTLSTTPERLEGFAEGLDRRGLSVEHELIASGGGVPAQSYEATFRLLSLPSPPTAFVTGNNQMTLGVIHALADLGQQVPQDVAVACFDDFEWAEYFSPRLTAIRQDDDRIGRNAVDLLDKRIAEPERPAQTLRIPADFMHRDSCGCGLRATGN